MKTEARLAVSQEVGAKLVAVFNRRMQVANEKLAQRARQASARTGDASAGGMATPKD